MSIRSPQGCAQLPSQSRATFSQLPSMSLDHRVLGTLDCWGITLVPARNFQKYLAPTRLRTKFACYRTAAHKKCLDKLTRHPIRICRRVLLRHPHTSLNSAVVSVVGRGPPATLHLRKGGFVRGGRSRFQPMTPDLGSCPGRGPIRSRRDETGDFSRLSVPVPTAVGCRPVPETVRIGGQRQMV